MKVAPATQQREQIHKIKKTAQNQGQNKAEKVKVTKAPPISSLQAKGAKIRFQTPKKAQKSKKISVKTEEKQEKSG